MSCLCASGEEPPNQRTATPRDADFAERGSMIEAAVGPVRTFEAAITKAPALRQQLFSAV